MKAPNVVSSGAGRTTTRSGTVSWARTLSIQIRGVLVCN